MRGCGDAGMRVGSWDFVGVVVVDGGGSGGEVYCIILRFRHPRLESDQILLSTIERSGDIDTYHSTREVMRHECVVAVSFYHRP
jgi:hypothetical protein